jgi:TonB family protein
MSNRLFSTILLAAALLPAELQAKSWPDAGGWSIGETDDSCAIFDSFEGKGETELFVFLYLDGSVGTSITNTGWSPTEGQKYEMSWVLNGQSYSGTNVGTGGKYAYRKGFVAKFDASFADDFARGSSLRIYRGDVLVDQLSLDGTAAAVAMARRCLTHIRELQAADERERQRFSHIADDPFAVGRTTQEVEKFGEIVPVGNPAYWVSYDDYPALALREERGGIVGFTLAVTPEGRASTCSITSSSGHPDLDAQTCALLERRARFKPTDSGGTYSNRVTWSIPK